MGLFLVHVKTARPGQSAIFGSLASDGVYQSTTDGIHRTPLVTHAQTDTPINAMLYAIKRYTSFFAYAGCGFNIG